MSEHKTRTLLPSEWEKYRDVRLRSLVDAPHAFGSTHEANVSKPPEEWMRILEHHPNVFLEEAETNNFVGMVGAFSKDGEMYTINQMWIDPIARGKGNGKLLMEAIISEVKERGATKVSLYVNVNQAPAVALYEKLGFVIVETSKDEKMGDGTIVDEYIMELSI